MEKPLNISESTPLAMEQTPAISQNNTHYWWKVVALCFMGWVLICADRTILNPVMPQIAKDFHINNAELGIVSSVFFLSYALAQLPFGVLSEKIGRRAVIAIGFVIFGIMTFLSGIVTTFAMFLILRLIAGMGEGSYYGPQYALSGEAIPLSKLTLGTAIINSGMAFGSAGGYMLSSYLVLQHHMPWRLPFLIIAVPTILIGLLFLGLKEHAKRSGKTAAKPVVEKVVDQPQPESKASLKTIFTNRNLLLTFFMCFCSIYAYFVVLTWLPEFLQVERGYTGTSVGFVSSIVPWASIPGALLFAKVYDRFNHVKTLVWILVPLAVISLLVVGFTTNHTIMIAALLVYGFFGKLAIDPILVSFTTREAGRRSLSTTLSAYNLVGMSGSILAPYITGYLSDKLGSMTTGFYLGAGILLIGAIAFSFTKTTSTDKALANED